MCGVLTSVQRKRNREGKPWAALHLEDWAGRVDAMVFSNAYEEVVSELAVDKAVMVRGVALPEDGAPSKVSITGVVPLEVARLNLPRLISIRVFIGQESSATENRAGELVRLFENKPGEAEVRLRLEKPRDFSVILDVGARVRPDREFRAEVERICGSGAMEVLAD
jgi:DNA polymerase-3 subunit alpha